MTKKIYQEYEFNAALKVQDVDELPTWTTADKRRLIRVPSDGMYYGGEAAWHKFSDSEHDHDGDYAAASHTHTRINNNLTITGNLGVEAACTVESLLISSDSYAGEIINEDGTISYNRLTGVPEITYCTYCSYCTLTSYCNYCSYCTYCTDCAYCTYCDCDCDCTDS